ncbi:MAG TPA: hypothetical protein VNR65_13590, partial [Geobacterales bacterium]|nr:hypothetical protein [Geobacterales bacterium]
RSDRAVAVLRQNTLLEATITQDLPGQFDEIKGPQPFKIGFGLDVLDHHLADCFKVASAFAWEQVARL